MSNFRKDNIVQETKELAASSRTNTEVGEVTILGRQFVVLPKVFDPRVFFSTAWFAKTVAELVKGETSFCEVGCGTGVVVITTLLENQSITAVAVGINPYAVQNTKENAIKHDVGDRIEVLESDVLDSVPEGKKFDSIFWAMPFGYIEPEEETDIVDLQTFDPGYRAITKFFETARNSLKENGRLIVGFSKEIGTEELFKKLVLENGYSMILLATEEGTEKSSVTMQIYEIKISGNKK